MKRPQLSPANQNLFVRNFRSSFRRPLWLVDSPQSLPALCLHCSKHMPDIHPCKYEIYMYIHPCKIWEWDIHVIYIYTPVCSIQWKMSNPEIICSSSPTSFCYSIIGLTNHLRPLFIVSFGVWKSRCGCQIWSSSLICKNCIYLYYYRLRLLWNLKEEEKRPLSPRIKGADALRWFVGDSCKGWDVEPNARPGRLSPVLWWRALSIIWLILWSLNVSVLGSKFSTLHQPVKHGVFIIKTFESSSMYVWFQRGCLIFELEVVYQLTVTTIDPRALGISL